MRAFAVTALALATCLSGCSRSNPLSPAGSGHALVGQKAPLFTTVMLDDSPFDLAEHLGKSVIILDFWATWCGPCVAALPIISQVAGEYQGKGVEFFAVNIAEEAGGVRAFLDEHKLNIPVVLDRDGGIGNLYKAESIPQTVIIGKDGTVAVVHVGFSPNLKSELAHELDALLAGNKLSAAPRVRRNDSLVAGAK